MTLLILELPPSLYDALRHRAAGMGKTPQQYAEGVLAQELVPASQERDMVADALRAAGLLTTLTADEKRMADAVTVTLSEVQTALDRAGGKPLSEVIIEMRGPKG